MTRRVTRGAHRNRCPVAVEIDGLIETLYVRGSHAMELNAADRGMEGSNVCREPDPQPCPWLRKKRGAITPEYLSQNLLHASRPSANKAPLLRKRRKNKRP